MLVCGSDLLESFKVPGLWSDEHVSLLDCLIDFFDTSIHFDRKPHILVNGLQGELRSTVKPQLMVTSQLGESRSVRIMSRKSHRTMISNALLDS